MPNLLCLHTHPKGRALILLPRGTLAEALGMLWVLEFLAKFISNKQEYGDRDISVTFKCTCLYERIQTSGDGNLFMSFFFSHEQ